MLTNLPAKAFGMMKLMLRLFTPKPKKPMPFTRGIAQQAKEFLD